MTEKTLGKTLADIEQEASLITKNDPWTKVGSLVNLVQQNGLWVHSQRSFTSWLKYFCKKYGFSFNTVMQQKNMVGILKDFVNEHNNSIRSFTELPSYNKKLFEIDLKKRCERDNLSYKSFLNDSAKFDLAFKTWVEKNNGLTKVKKITLDEAAIKIPFDSVRSISRLTENMADEMTYYFLGMAYDGLLTSFRLKKFAKNLVKAKKINLSLNVYSEKANSVMAIALNKSVPHLLRKIRKEKTSSPPPKESISKIYQIKPMTFLVLENFTNLTKNKINIHLIENSIGKINNVEFQDGIDYFWLMTTKKGLEEAKRKIVRYHQKHSPINSGILTLQDDDKISYMILAKGKNNTNLVVRNKLLEKIIIKIITNQTSKKSFSKIISKKDVFDFYDYVINKRPGLLTKKEGVKNINSWIENVGTSGAYIAIASNGNNIIIDKTNR